MANSMNNVGTNTISRVIWLDPNKANNVMVNTEDLSIKVQFTSTRKNRSIIYSQNQTISTEGKSGSVTFIEGSYVNQQSSQPSLTTRYTDVTALEVMNLTADNVDDFESLGIESIDIEFNTSFAPMIKIKFIDVRGNAILTQGNMSKYKMFFELPYPLFSLKVKGFYGKTVDYCLHMQRWNAAFNSETGNFEIQAEFIGYTYALLTDMLMGLIRAAVRTKKGQEKLAKKKAEYGENSNLVISIDEMLGKLSDLSFSFKKISEDDDSVKQLNTYDDVEEDLKNIKGAFDTLSTTIYDGQNPPNNYFRSSDGGVLGVPIDDATTKKIDEAIKVYKETVKPLISTVNSKVDDGFKLNEELLIGKNSIVKISEINYIDLINEEAELAVPIAITKSGGAYENNDTDKDKVRIILRDVRNSLKTPLPNGTKMNIYSLLKPLYEIDNKTAALKTNADATKRQIGEKLAQEAENTIGFEPTIRNIFRVLCISCEIFLETLRDVSFDAESDTGGRAEQFNKISGKINVNGKEVTNKHIYAWPEYREKKGNEGYVETWLGSAPGIIPSKIQEVVFVEEMLKCLMDVARFDNELEERQAEEEQGGDIDSQPEEIKDPWFPISVVDTPPSGVNENPYNSVVEGNVDEAIRLLLMRGFLLLGVTNFNSKIDSDLASIYGGLEAANLYEAAKKTKNGLDVIRQLQNIGGKTDPKEQVNYIKNNNGLKGTTTIKNPGVDDDKEKPIFKILNDEKIEYTYISDGKGRSYIPVNNNFDGAIFYNVKKLKDEDTLKNSASGTIYVTNHKNLSGTLESFKSKDDGSYIFKIIDSNTYNGKIMTPGYALDTVETYKKKFAEKTIEPSSFKTAYIDNLGKPNKFLKILNPLGGKYAALEINTLNYVGYTTDVNNDGLVGEGHPKNSIGSSISAFYVQNIVNFDIIGGSYLTYKNSTNDYYKNRMPNEENKKFKIEVFDAEMSIIRKTNPRKKFYRFGKQKDLIDKFLIDGTKPYVPFIEFGYDEYTFSLFGSKFYNYQKKRESKALLFLHTFPWQGILTPENLAEFAMFDTISESKTSTENIDNLDENSEPTRIYSIKSMFKLNGAFVQAPKAWVLMIGGILWRRRYALTNKNDDPIDWKDKNGKMLIPTYVGRVPTYNEFLHFTDDIIEQPWGMYFYNKPEKTGTQSEAYTPIDNTILGLPRIVKNELISYFENWVNDETNGFKYFQKELEIWYGKDSDKSESETSILKYQNKWKLIDLAINKSGDMNTSKITQYLNDNPNILKNYNMITTPDSKVGAFNMENDLPDAYQFNLELRPDTEVMDNIVGLLTSGVYIQNCSPSSFIPSTTIDSQPIIKVFGTTDNGTIQVFDGSIITGVKNSVNDKTKQYNPITADRSLFFNYFLGEFFKKINETKPNEEKVLNEEDEIQQEIFGTTDDKTIKLIIYRTLSSINDKWINGTKDGDLFAQCPGSNTNQKDIELANKYRSGATKAELIDTFRFVDRAFWDIGDKFYININSVSDLIRKNYNQSFFDVVNKILTDNNFNFIPLPTFVNFNNVEELKTVFTPYSYNDEVGFDGTGPSFVCCYVGQTSVNLDLGVEAVYPDDGLSLNMDVDSSDVNLADELEDFSKTLEPGEFNVPVFSVNYGQQNQNYFRSVKLDQREFTETMESLQTIEDISQGGDKSKPTYIGNNLFNVYQTRSYSAEVEMMGSAMIQPMMYFQLNNIPMFRGAYLIYKVNHTIKPHSMTTTIKGNRVKKAKTPLVDKYTMYMNLIEGTSGGGGTASIRQAAGDPNATADAKFIDTNLNFYWLDKNGNIPTGKDTLGITNTNRQWAGLKPYNGKSNDPYLVREVAEVLQKASLKLWQVNSGTTKADTVYFGDCSKLWGGPLEGHKSHKNGIDIDTRGLRYDKSSAATGCKDNGKSGYSREVTKQWLKYLSELSYRPYTVKKDRTYINTEGKSVTVKANTTVKDQKTVKIIGFQDSKLQSEAADFGIELTPWPNHCDHLHIRFYTPLRVVEESESGTNTRPATQANPSDTVQSVSGGKKVKPQALPQKNAGTMLFYDKLLKKLGAPTTEGNLFFLMAWHQIENSACNWNAFNTKQQFGNSYACITTGVNKNVQFYRNIDEGVGGTYKTITSKTWPEYQQIVDALKAGIKDKQDAYNTALRLEGPGGGLSRWKNGDLKGIKPNTYITNILGNGKMSGKNITGSS